MPGHWPLPGPSAFVILTWGHATLFLSVSGLRLVMQQVLCPALGHKTRQGPLPQRAPYPVVVQTL